MKARGAAHKEVNTLYYLTFQYACISRAVTREITSTDATMHLIQGRTQSSKTQKMYKFQLQIDLQLDIADGSAGE